MLPSTYDDNGNRTMGGYVIGANNRILSDGTYDYEYDDEGNQTAKETIATGERVEYTWDYRNRLTTITFKDALGVVTKSVDQSYDIFNQWVRSQVDSDGDLDFDSERFFIYDDGQIVLEFDGGTASDLSHRYLWGEAVDQLFADEQVASPSSAGDVIWPVSDHLGTPRDLLVYESSTNTTSNANHRTYDSFGNLVSETNGTVTILIGFTGRPHDKNIGLNNHLHRWYDPTTGTWKSLDPIGFAAGDANLGRYVENSALSLADPTGLDGEADDRLPVDGPPESKGRGYWLPSKDPRVQGPVKPGQGWFHFHDRNLSPIFYEQRWQGRGRPNWSVSGIVVSDQAEPCVVKIDQISGNRNTDGNRANAVMRATRNQNWQQPPNTTWDHTSTDGTMTLVRRPEHAAASHTGAVGDQNAALRQGRIPSPTTRVLPRSASSATSPTSSATRTGPSRTVPQVSSTPRFTGRMPTLSPRFSGSLRGLGTAGKQFGPEIAIGILSTINEECEFEDEYEGGPVDRFFGEVGVNTFFHIINHGFQQGHESSGFEVRYNEWLIEQQKRGWMPKWKW